MDTLLLPSVMAASVIIAIVVLLRVLAKSIVKSHVNNLLYCNFGVEVGRVTEICIDGGKCVNVSSPLKWCVGKCVNNNIAIISKSNHGFEVAIKVLRYLLREGYRLLIVGKNCSEVTKGIGINGDYVTCANLKRVNEYIKSLITDSSKLAVFVDLRDEEFVTDEVIRLTKIAGYGDSALVLLTNKDNSSLMHTIVSDAGLIIEELDDSSARVKLVVKGRTPKELGTGVLAKTLILR